MNTARRFLISFLLVLVGLRAGKAMGDISMNFDNLTTSPYITFGSSLYSGSPPSESANLATYQTDTPGAWYGGNYVPDQFQLAPFNGGSVLQMGIAPSQYQSSPGTGFSSLNFQGMKYDTSLSGPQQSMSVDINVQQSWTSSSPPPIDFGMAAFDNNAVVAAIAFITSTDNSDPVQIEKSPITDIYGYDSNEWHPLILQSPFNDNSFNAIGFALNTLNGMITYNVNGYSVRSQTAPTGTTSLQSVMLYALNPKNSIPNPDNVDSLYQFDNFAATSGSVVPEPPTASIVGIGALLGALLLLGIRHRRGEMLV